jgi:hypothetical protein
VAMCISHRHRWSFRYLAKGLAKLRPNGVARASRVLNEWGSAYGTSATWRGPMPMAAFHPEAARGSIRALPLVRSKPRRRLQPDPRGPCAAAVAAQPALDGAHGRGLALDDGQHPVVQLAAMAARQAVRGDGLAAGETSAIVTGLCAVRDSRRGVQTPLRAAGKQAAGRLFVSFAGPRPVRLGAIRARAARQRRNRRLFGLLGVALPFPRPRDRKGSAGCWKPYLAFRAGKAPSWASAGSAGAISGSRAIPGPTPSAEPLSAPRAGFGGGMPVLSPWST